MPEDDHSSWRDAVGAGIPGLPDDLLWDDPRRDPYDRRYSPQHAGDGGLGDVGSGEGFGADLYELYKAGRLELPAVAATYAELTRKIHEQDGPMQALFEGPTYTPEASHRLILHLRDDLQESLRMTSVNVEAAGRALVDIADSYVATDEAAAAEFRRLIGRERDSYPPDEIPIADAPRPGPPGSRAQEPA